MNNVIISNGIIIENDRITLSNKILPPLPKKYSSVNLTTINDENFINGYKWKMVNGNALYGHYGIGSFNRKEWQL